MWSGLCQCLINIPTLFGEIQNWGGETKLFNVIHVFSRHVRVTSAPQRFAVDWHIQQRRLACCLSWRAPFRDLPFSRVNSVLPSLFCLVFDPASVARVGHARLVCNTERGAAGNAEDQTFIAFYVNFARRYGCGGAPMISDAGVLSPPHPKPPRA